MAPELVPSLSAPLAARGEATITIGTRVLKLKTSSASLEGIEEDLDCSIIKVMGRIVKGDIRLKDLKIITWRLAREAGEVITLKEMGDLLLANEYLTIASLILRPLADAVTAGKAELPNV